jgi:hypothetical protein
MNIWWYSQCQHAQCWQQRQPEPSLSGLGKLTWPKPLFFLHCSEIRRYVQLRRSQLAVGGGIALFSIGCQVSAFGRSTAGLSDRGLGIALRAGLHDQPVQDGNLTRPGSSPDAGAWPGPVPLWDPRTPSGGTAPLRAPASPDWSAWNRPTSTDSGWGWCSGQRFL